MHLFILVINPKIGKTEILVVFIFIKVCYNC